MVLLKLRLYEMAQQRQQRLDIELKTCPQNVGSKKKEVELCPGILLQAIESQ